MLKVKHSKGVGPIKYPCGSRWGHWFWEFDYRADDRCVSPVWWTETRWRARCSRKLPSSPVWTETQEVTSSGFCCRTRSNKVNWNRIIAHEIKHQNNLQHFIFLKTPFCNKLLPDCKFSSRRRTCSITVSCSSTSSIAVLQYCSIAVPLRSPPGSGTRCSSLLPPRTRWPENRSEVFQR